MYSHMGAFSKSMLQLVLDSKGVLMCLTHREVARKHDIYLNGNLTADAAGEHLLHTHTAFLTLGNSGYLVLHSIRKTCLGQFGYGANQ